MRVIQGIGLAIVTAALLVGCGKSETSSTSTASGGKKLRLAFVTNNASDFWTIARAGCEKAVAELKDAELDFQIPSDGTAATQKRIVQDLLARGVDGIAISPKDPANQTDLLNEAASHALLVTQDSDAPQSNRACYVGTDNVAAGRQAGELIKKAVPSGGKAVVFVGSMDAQNARERLGGIKEVLEGSGVVIADIRTDETDPVKAKSNVKDTILNHPDVAILIGLWSYNGPAIVSAVKEADKAGKIQIVCFDEEDATLQGVKDGAIFATVVQQPYEFGYQAMKLMANYLRGDKSVIPSDKKIIVPTLAIDKEHVDEFWAKLKQLRGK
jgi:ribose transport system substrate-binding protein